MKTNEININSISKVGNYNDTDRSRIDQMIRNLVRDFFSENQIQLADFTDLKLGVYFDREPVLYAIATKQDGTEEIIDSEQISLSTRSVELLHLMLGLTPPVITSSTSSSKPLRKLPKTSGNSQPTPPPPSPKAKNRIPFSAPISETSETEEELPLQPLKKFSKNGPVSPVEDKNTAKEEIKGLREQFQDTRKKGKSKRSSINVSEFSGKKEESSDPILNKSKGKEEQNEALKKLNEMRKKQHDENGVGRRESMLFDPDQKRKKRINFPNVPEKELNFKKDLPSNDNKKGRTYRTPEGVVVEEEWSSTDENEKDRYSGAPSVDEKDLFAFNERTYKIPNGFTFPGYFSDEENKRTYNIPSDYSDEEEYHSAVELDKEALEEILIQAAENEEMKNKNELLEETLGIQSQVNHLRKFVYPRNQVIENYQEAIENLKKLL